MNKRHAMFFSKQVHSILIIYTKYSHYNKYRIYLLGVYIYYWVPGRLETKEQRLETFMRR